MSNNPYKPDDDLNDLLRDACAASAPEERFVDRLARAALERTGCFAGRRIISYKRPTAVTPRPLSRSGRGE